LGRTVPGHSPQEVASYLSAGYWGTRTVADHVAGWAISQPDSLAFADEETRITWSEYDRLSSALALELMDRGLEAGDRVAALFPDSAATHVAWLAAEKSGLVSVGIGARAGDREIRHLLRQGGARAVISGDVIGRTPVAGIVDDLRAEGRDVLHLVMDPLQAAHGWLPRGSAGARLRGATNGTIEIERRRLGASDLFMLNSTSGTTGTPKCVMHTQNRWAYFHQLAVDAGELTAGDVFFSALPAPFGFGLWTAHFTPTFLGAPAHVMRRFDADALLSRLAEERVTVLAAVTTQLIMLLNSPLMGEADLRALRVIFTGGEAVPFEKAREFEDRTGARVLQFYGSNETGAVSRTTLRDDRQRRLSTAGRVIPEMNLRLVDPVSHDIVAGTLGQPACRGPATCEGYWNDPDGNARLYTRDGWMLMGDLVEVDSDGYLRVVGRTSDIIIRGGKNISASAVEAEVMTHPSVSMAAAVPVPDAIFGERVCVYVELREGQSLTLADLNRHLETRGVTREWFPEHLFVTRELPHSSGGKVAKGELGSDARQRLSAEP
jgi:acyl-CoA synthetase